MCRSIVTLRGAEPAADDEVRAAALQFVRKVSGYRHPSRANQDVFEDAVEEVATSVRRLLDGLSAPGTRAPATRAPATRVPATRAPATRPPPGRAPRDGARPAAARAGGRQGRSG